MAALNQNPARVTCPRLDAVPLVVLEDESEDVLGMVVQAMKMFPVNEEVQLHGCGALQLLLNTGQVGEGSRVPVSHICGVTVPD